MGMDEVARNFAIISFIAHRTPAQYRTVMVPQTVMVALARAYYAPIAPRCATCGY